MEKYCDNKSVGVVLHNELGQIALLERGRFPVGMAPPAGHIDDHGSPEQAAVDEVAEELGVVLDIAVLGKTAITKRLVKNTCRRANGTHHEWTVFSATVQTVPLYPDAHETKGAGWYDLSSLQVLADRTQAFAGGKISNEAWNSRSGLELVWLSFLSELGLVK